MLSCSVAVMTHAGRKDNPTTACWNDSYSFIAEPGETILQKLNVLINDGSTAVGALRVIKVEDPPGSFMQGTVQPLDQQGVLYTVTYHGVEFIDAFSYVMQDGAGATCQAYVKVHVGE
jgi:hypothetical protein